jgi:hypothetical protein
VHDLAERSDVIADIPADVMTEYLSCRGRPSVSYSLRDSASLPGLMA